MMHATLIEQYMIATGVFNDLLCPLKEFDLRCSLTYVAAHFNTSTLRRLNKKAHKPTQNSNKIIIILLGHVRLRAYRPLQFATNSIAFKLVCPTRCGCTVGRRLVWKVFNLVSFCASHASILNCFEDYNIVISTMISIHRGRCLVWRVTCSLDRLIYQVTLITDVSCFLLSKITSITADIYNPILKRTTR